MTTVKKKKSKLPEVYPKIICMSHSHNRPLSTTNFYDATEDSMFANAPEAKIPFCKDCAKKKFIDYYAQGKNLKWAVYKMCEKMDLIFVNTLFEAAVKEANTWESTLGIYIKNHNSLGAKNYGRRCFDESEGVEFDFNADGNFEVREIEYKLSKDDRMNMKSAVAMLGYDPFDGYSELDRKFMFGNIMPYLSDEDILEDQYKVDAIIQIVDNNNQLRKYRYLLNQYSSDPNMILEHQDKLKSLGSLIKDLSDTNIKIAKENGIAESGKKGKSNNKSSLTGMMKYLRDLNFEDAEVDYYDQKKSFGMQNAANISMEAIKGQLGMDENIISEIAGIRREMVLKMEEKILDLEEENRQLYVTIKDLKEGDN